MYGAERAREREKEKERERVGRMYSYESQTWGLWTLDRKEKDVDVKK